MRTLLLLWLFVAPGADTLQVMFWNVENFFDWRNDSTTVSDMEFSAAGERHWTWKRFQAKANAFAKALFWVEAETGRLPDVIGLEEVENAFVLRQVLQKTALRKLDYKYVHYDSPDHRGIDVALLYRSSRLELLDSKPCHLYVADSVMATRDILLCVFRRAVSPVLSSSASSVMPDPPSFVMPDHDRASIATFQEIPGQAGNDGSGRAGKDGKGGAGKDGAFAVLVNHHPSKYGGAAESEPRRRIAVERLRFLADSLAAIGIDRIIAGGDFNDTPDNPVFQQLEPALAPMHMDLFRRGLGTIKYDGKWDLIDHIYVSPALLDAPMSAPASDSSLGVTGRQEDTVGAPSARARMRILRIPFLLTRDTVHSGEKPLRTYTGPRHTGGVSDHLPVLLEVPLPP
jgi:endonuclease/exonuclease/phosphatase family metal-dependent hydrolase